ncbi:MAG TPA: hypothetical protein H9936_06290, partial [Candidatus Agathobaculum intestinigallinarum]|nr:hypothetical protein [Candidatus Agathobaculum intestinigallinarum]
MSTTTDVLSLFKYDPVADADSTFNITQGLNNNWDKIDTALLLAIAAAGAYNPEESYAVGDYCTYKGKLHKCGTAIPDGEAWNAEHWTETTVAAELAEVRASQSNMAAVHPVKTYIGLAKIGITSDTPISTEDVCVQMPVSTELFDDTSSGSTPKITDIPFMNSTLHIVKLSNPRCYCVCIDRDNNGVAVATWTTSQTPNFSGWKEIATAMPPGVHNLTLASG